MTEDAELLDSSSVLTFVILRLTFPTLVPRVRSSAGHSGTTSTSTRTMCEPPPLSTPISGLTSE
jgi:hypothetical protein